MKKNLLLTVVMALFAWSGYAQIISQYVETSSGTTPKGLEIWNNTAAPLDFSVNNLEVQKGGNGGDLSTVKTISEGVLAVGDVMIIGTSDMEAVATSAGVTYNLYGFSFNGDDALAIVYGGTITDIFGTPGTDPGSEWVNGDVSTKNLNLGLKDGIVVGDIDGWSDPSERFEKIAGGTDLSGFGIAPTSTGGEVVVKPVLSDVMPVSGSVYLVDEEFYVSATVTTIDAAGIDSVVLAYGDATDALTDTVMMEATDSVYSVMMDMGDEGSKYGKIIVYAGNGEMTMSSSIEVIAQDFKMFDMEKALYQIIVDTVNARGTNTYYSPETGEDFYGANAKYNNFSAGDGAYDSVSFMTSDAAIEVALSTILLPAVRPTATVEDTFVIAYALYQGDASTGSMTFACTSVAPLTFTKVVVEEVENVLVAFTMDSMDYQLIVNYTIAEELNTKTSDSLISENYYGASAKYDNFDARDGKFDSIAFVTYEAAIEAALSTALLPASVLITAIGSVGEIKAPNTKQ